MLENHAAEDTAFVISLRREDFEELAKLVQSGKIKSVHDLVQTKLLQEMA